MWLRVGTVALSLEQGNETLESIKGGEFLDYMGENQVIGKDSAPWS
jgi:hypothetical protein